MVRFDGGGLALAGLYAVGVNRALSEERFVGILPDFTPERFIELFADNLSFSFGVLYTL